jgi:cathepsin A (carboxypeptidase C)
VKSWRRLVTGESSTCPISFASPPPKCDDRLDLCLHVDRVNNKFVCVPATLSCWSGFGQLQDLGLNMYDTRKKCDRAEDKDGPVILLLEIRMTSGLCN